MFFFFRLHESSIPLVPYMLFGDFNFRLDNKRVVEVQSKVWIFFSKLPSYRVFMVLLATYSLLCSYSWVQCMLKLGFFPRYQRALHFWSLGISLSL